MVDWNKKTDDWWYDDLLEALEEIEFDSFSCALREFAEDENWVEWVGVDFDAEWLSDWIEEYREDYHDEGDPRCVKLLEVLEYFWENEWSDQDE